VISVFDVSTHGGIGPVEVEIFDVQGRLVRKIHQPANDASVASVGWDGKDDRGHPLGSGRYWLRVRAGALEGTRAVLILR
jgi:flagellar hook assembly protein FlgD